MELEKLRAGSPDAFKQLAAQYAQETFCVAYAVLFSTAQAHLIAEKTFKRAYRDILQYDANVCDVRDWLCRLAYDEAKQYVREQRSVTVRVHKKSGPEELLPKTVFIAKEQTFLRVDESVLASLNVLPDIQREALLLHDGYGLDFDRLSFITGESAGSLRSRLSLARTNMKKSLEKKWKL